MSNLWNLFLSSLAQAFLGGPVGSAVAQLTAWLSANSNEILRKVWDLFVNSDVVGAALGVFLAIRGASFIETRRRTSTVKSAKALAQKTAGDLVSALTKYDDYMMNYYFGDENGVRSDGTKIWPGESVDRAQAILRKLERAAISFDIAFELGRDSDPSEMVPIAHLSQSVKAGTDGLLEISRMESGDGKRNPEVYKLYSISLLERMRMKPDLNEYAAKAQLWQQP